MLFKRAANNGTKYEDPWRDEKHIKLTRPHETSSVGQVVPPNRRLLEAPERLALIDDTSPVAHGCHALQQVIHQQGKSQSAGNLGCRDRGLAYFTVCYALLCYVMICCAVSLSLSLYIYIYMYVYMYIYIYICMYLSLSLYIYIYIYMYYNIICYVMLY